MSVWEVAVKAQIGKLRPPEDWLKAVATQDFQILPFGYQHALAVFDLPLIHKDPFDRALLAQAKAEGFTLVTADAILSQYLDNVRLLMC
jgi:PIN domain nuclease of toxin-antitoxin system